MLIKKRFTLILFVIILLSVAVLLQSAFAQVSHWWATVDGVWSSAGSWETNSTPTVADDVYINSAYTTTSYTVTLDTSPTVSSITVGDLGGSQTLALGLYTLTTGSAAAFGPVSTLSTMINGTLLFGKVVSSGTATINLGGTLNVSLGYTPSPGDSFQIISGPTAGTFATTNLPALTGMAWNTTYTPGGLKLQVGYSIAASAGAGGIISPSGTIVAASGANQTYTITPNSGFQVQDVLVDSVSVGAVTTYTFTSVSANHTISASFSAVGFTISAVAGTGGMINPSGSVSATAGASAFFTINAYSGYRIDMITIDGKPLGDRTASTAVLSSSYTFINVQSNHTIAAFFVPNTAPSISGASPSSNSILNTASVGYSLSKPAASGSITFTQVGGTTDPASPQVYTFTTPDCAPGGHTVNTGLALVNGAIYDITIAAADSVGNSGHKIINSVTYEITLLTIDSPQASSFMNSANVGYTLLQNISSGDITATWTGGTADPLAPYRYSLSGSQRLAGSHTVNTGFSLVNQAIYTIASENVLDANGASTSSGSGIQNVTFDNQSVGVTNALPTVKSIATTTIASYTLSEDALSGSIAFTWSGGVKDNALHLYNLSSADLTKGNHSLDTGFVLVNEAFYTVTFQFDDKAGNPTTTLSNGMVYYCPTYGTGPVGDVDGSGKVDSADLQKLQSAVGSRPGDANWNPVCDLDGNNIIDQQDLLILMQHYGQ